MLCNASTVRKAQNICVCSGGLREVCGKNVPMAETQSEIDLRSTSADVALQDNMDKEQSTQPSHEPHSTDARYVDRFSQESMAVVSTLLVSFSSNQ